MLKEIMYLYSMGRPTSGKICAKDHSSQAGALITLATKSNVAISIDKSVCVRLRFFVHRACTPNMFCSSVLVASSVGLL